MDTKGMKQKREARGRAMEAVENVQEVDGRHGINIGTMMLSFFK